MFHYEKVIHKQSIELIRPVQITVWYKFAVFRPYNWHYDLNGDQICVSDSNNCI